MIKYPSVIGTKINKLNVLKLDTERTTNKQKYYKCRCDCGTEFSISARQLLYNKEKTKSCGCFNLSPEQIAFRKEPFFGDLNSLLNVYKGHARIRGLNFDLSLVEFKLLTSSNCFYCGIPPQQKYSRKLNLRKDGIQEERYLYNGVDRKDNLKGYSLQNCVSCCHICNYAKNDHNFDKFNKWIDNLVEYRLSLKNELDLKILFDSFLHIRVK